MHFAETTCIDASTPPIQIVFKHTQSSLSSGYFFYPLENISKHIQPLRSGLICIKSLRTAVLNDVSDCTTWQFDMIQYLISTAVLSDSMHTSPAWINREMNQIPGLRDCYDPTRVVVVFLSEKKLLSRTTWLMLTTRSIMASPMDQNATRVLRSSALLRPWASRRRKCVW